MMTSTFRLLGALGLALWALAPSPARAQAFDPDVAVRQIAAHIRDHYVVEERIARLTEALEQGLRDGAYKGLTDPEAVSARLTAQLKALSNDNHLYVRAVAATQGRRSAADWEARERQQERDTNFGFPHVQTFPGGVGYIRISAFMEPQRALPSAVAAMQQVRTARAIVFDLRGNGGGYGGLPGYLATYFFEPGPTLLSTQRMRTLNAVSVTTTHSDAAVVGDRRVGTPVWILVDRKTASAAEWFAYVLQSFGKARVVGETSAGAAHMNSFFDLAPGVRLSVSTSMPLSAANQKNWEGTGVVPDVPCPPEEALAVALKLAGQEH
jgi:hypothetical protein